MRITLGLLSSALLASSALVACTAESDPPEVDEPIELEAEEQIIGGTVDTTTDAVVQVLQVYSNGQIASTCTGTVIAQSGSYAYVLTAAHCTNMNRVAVVDDLNECFSAGGCDLYSIDQQAAHPNYNGNNVGAGYDFRMLRVVKGGANLSVIPIPSGSDGLSTGASIRLVGFGITSANNGDNSQRRTVDVNVNQLSSTLIRYSQTNGKGACSGDSGGPALFNNTVVGVTSFGDQNCTQFGASGRVSLVSNWITGFINGETPPPNCDQCFGAAVNGGGCEGAVDACFNDAACAALAECLYNCAPNSSTCINNCANQHPNGIDKYNAIFDCACSECSTECAAECTDPSTSSSSNSSSSSTGAGGGETGAGGAGGGASGDDGGDDDDGGTKPVTTVTTCNCATVGGPDASGGAALALGGFVALAFAAGRRRRQR